MQRLPIVILLLQHNIILFSCAFFLLVFPPLTGHLGFLVAHKLMLVVILAST